MVDVKRKMLKERVMDSRTIWNMCWKRRLKEMMILRGKFNSFVHVCFFVSLLASRVEVREGCKGRESVTG